MSARKAKVALAATAQALQDGREAVNHFTLRVSDPAAKQLMATLLDHHVAAISRLRCRLLEISNHDTTRKAKTPCTPNGK